MASNAYSRRAFIRTAGAVGVGLVLATELPGCGPKPPPVLFAPNAWLRIAPDDAITVILNKSEMGQGVILGLPTIIAEELDASFDRISVEFAPVGEAYIDPAFGMMITGGSTSVADMWVPLRNAGATARGMLVAAAAKQWSVDPQSCTTRDGVVYHDASQRKATYGSLTDAAASMPVPKDVPLKSASAFKLIGKHRSRPDIPSKVNGLAQYGIDVRVPNMMYAAIARSPVFGGRVKSFDATKAKAVPGVTQVVQISNGVAVVAKNTWAAFQGKSQLDIAWDEGPNANLTSAALFAEADGLAASHRGEHVAVTRGTPNTSAGIVVEAIYRGPFLAHATMEPQTATADVRDDRCEVWAPNQVQQRCQADAMAVTGLPADKVIINTTLLGGGFGRRLESDYVREAVEVSKAAKVPVKVTWTREDDIQNEFYRPMSLNVVRGVVEGGNLKALSHRVVSASWFLRWNPKFLKNGIDETSIAEAIDAPYRLPNFEVTFTDHEHGIPVGSWRSPDASWNCFVTESFIDELAHAAGKDPVQFRLGILVPRAANVLKLAVEKAKWGQSQKGVAQGVAIVYWNGSYGAMIADVSMVGGQPKVHRVVAAIDCGTIVNPDIITQQGVGATYFGLSAALTGKITIGKGRVEQHNFYDYTVLRMADAPPVDVYTVESSEKPTGIGEVCTPPIAPAVANAVFALTAKRVRMLPFSDALA